MFDAIISIDNLFAAWREFSTGKRKKPDVQLFEFNLEDEIFQLRESLFTGTYRVQAYSSFYLSDPKLRHIHKASVRDRVLFQAVFRVLYPIFNPSFIFDSYASRSGKGTHVGVNRLERFLVKASQNNQKKVWALKCDVRKFFDSINHATLLALIKKKISDGRALRLIETIVHSFEKSPSKGLSLGNVTSQLFANIYLHQLDFYIKHTLKIKYYLRYCDDFVIVEDSPERFNQCLSIIGLFLKDHLQLALHPKKVEIRSYAQGIDFLGYVLRPHHRTLRTRTRQRMFRKITKINEPSYLGVLKHCDGFVLKMNLLRKLEELS